MNIAINTIGGKLALLRPTGPSGHWLDVQLSTFSPGALVTVVLPGGQRLVRQVQAGSSYLSSEDPRLHFGLGNATTARLVTVRYPWGGESRSADVKADQVVKVSAPAPVTTRTTPNTTSYQLANCTHGGLREDARSHGSGTRRRSPCSGRAAPPSRSRLATCSTSPPRCGTPGLRTTRRRAATSSPRRRTRRTCRPRATQRSATRPTASCSGVRRSTRTSTPRLRC